MVEKQKKISSFYRTTLGRSGLRWSEPGYISEEFLTQLRGSRGIKIYREMSDNDPIVGACLYAIRQILREVRWSVKAADPDKDSKTDPDAIFLDESMRGMTHSWSDFISEAMSMFVYGWAWFEQVFRIREDGRATWKKIPLRAQSSYESWVMDKYGDTLGLRQRSSPDYTERTIPLSKSIHLRTESRANNPEGRSILRNAYRPWYFRKNFQEIEGIAVERDLTGLPVMSLPEGMKIEDDSEENKVAIQWAKDIVTNIRRDEQAGLVKPFGWGFDLVASPGKHQIDINKTIDRYSKEIAISLLAQFIMLGMERTGSYALAKELIDMFYASLEGFADYIASAFNRQAVALLFRINGEDDRPLPYVVHTEIKREMIRDMAYYVAALLKENALTLDDDLKAYLKRYARLEEFSEKRI